MSGHHRQSSKAISRTLHGVGLPFKEPIHTRLDVGRCVRGRHDGDEEAEATVGMAHFATHAVAELLLRAQRIEEGRPRQRLDPKIA
jgi:hypothetical protein